jgi:hypothetical protein
VKFGFRFGVELTANGTDTTGFKLGAIFTGEKDHCRSSSESSSKPKKLSTVKFSTDWMPRIPGRRNVNGLEECCSVGLKRRLLLNEDETCLGSVPPTLKFNLESSERLMEISGFW